jgi:hypothetical protein
MIKLFFIVSGSVNTTSQAPAVTESGLLSHNLLEKKVPRLIPSIDTATLGLSNDKLTTFDFIYSSGIENLKF